jgi:hypothetical protein
MIEDSGKSGIRFSMAELLFAATVLCLLIGSFAAWGIVGGAAAALLLGIAAYSVGRQQKREWMKSTGFWISILAGALLATCVAASDMEGFANIFFGWIQAFVGKPKAIAITGGVLFAATVYTYFLGVRNNRPLLYAAIAWLLYAPWEYYCVLQKANIRVDLLLVSPLLMLLTCWGLISTARGIVRLWRDTQPRPSRD